MHRPVARYRGFISYSHTDKAAARRLLSRLQTYRLPRKATPDERRRLGKFFIDRESLPVSGGLSEAIVAGLTEARSLIVLCSPSAAASPWVRLEIQTFLKINPHGQILAVILAGDPQARDGETACFPPELLADGQEPLAADFRKGADGPKLGFLKLAASLSGARLEALLQRDQTRSRRRVTAVTAGAAAITLGMFTLAAAAVTARTEAEARRAEAEGLIDFMLTDLKDRLEPVGRLDVLDGVAREVLDYYGGNDEALECAQVNRKARALQLDSQVHLSKTNLDHAEISSRMALDLSRNYQAQCQKDPAFAISYGHSAFYVGQSAWGRAVEAKRSGDMSGATPHFQQALEMYAEYDQAIAPLKAMEEYQQVFAQEAADNQTNFGAVQFQLENLRKAREHFNTAKSLIEPFANHIDAAPSDPDNIAPSQKLALATLANCYGWLAHIDELEENYDSAIEYRQSEVQLYTQLAGPNNSVRDWNHYRSALGSKLAIARTLLAAEQTASADRLLGELITETNTLVQNDPDNQQWKDFRAIVQRLMKSDQSPSFDKGNEQ